MKLETFFENFDLLTDAPNAATKLRELVLQLAVRGKLVERDSDDEPASELLERIQQNKQELIDRGELKRAKSLPVIQEEELPYKLSEGWHWERLANLARFIDYRGKTPPKTDRGIRLITAKNVRMGYVDYDPEEYISEETYPQWMTRGYPNHGDVLLTTEAPLGNVAQLLTEETVALAQRIINLQPYADFLPRYLLTALMSPFLQESLLENSSGTTARGIKSAKLQLILMPIPPLAEQKRIVEACDRILTLCDKIDQHQQQRHEKLVKMNEVAITKLLTAQTSDEFDTHWQGLWQNFDLLYSIPETIPKLRQAILQLAVQGKLVEQDPNDEPAQKLLDNIQKHRDANNIKRRKRSASIERKNNLTDIPSSWTWCQLKDIATVCLGGTPSRKEPSYWDGEIHWVSSGEVANCRIQTTKEYITESGLKNSNAKVYPPKTVLIAIIGQGKTRGQSAILDIEACTNQNVSGLVFDSGNVHPDYVWKWALGEYERTRSGGRGGAQPALNCEKVSNLWIPLPPLAEQKRIVAKVDRLMALCDAMEAKLTAARAQRETLMEAAARQVLAV
jgi:type I restriction enzyme S subunit